MNKEVSDALHMLLHCSLKDTEYDTQINQFNIVYKHIEILEEELKSANEEITWWSNRFNAVERDNRQLKEEKDTLYNALITTRTKYNNDKARYRRKAKRYKQKIDKAIEYIKEYMQYDENIEDCWVRTNDLIEILERNNNE